jgi:predicted NBD/HSP70 family sugar kinase
MVFEACRQGDAACAAILQAALNALARVVVNLITTSDPQVLVLGGGLTRSWDMFEKYFLPVVQEQTHPFFKGRGMLRHSELDGKEILLGAALLFRESEM